MIFDFSIITQYGSILIDGFLNTLYICAAGLILGLIIGAVACLIKMKSRGIGAGITNIYIELFRGTPFLIQTFILYYVGPQVGVNLSATVVGILCLGLYSGAYFAEIYRAGIQSIPRGQIEAAQALGIGEIAILFRIVLPQMLGLILAPLTNQMITLVKESAILSVITVQELTFAGQRVISETFSYVEIYTMVALLYWVLVTLMSFLSSQWEKHATRHLRVKVEPSKAYIETKKSLEQVS